MAVYTCNILLKHHVAGDMRPRLWADTPEEAMIAAYGCGASLDDIQPDTTWENYLITPEQQAAAITLGAKLCDYLEPRYQRAVREGDTGMIRCIELNRETAAKAVRVQR